MSLAQQVLEIELEGTDTGKYMQIVDGLTRKVSKAIRKEKAPGKIIRAMNAVFFEDEHFLVEEGKDKHPFLYQTLDSGGGNCYSLSLLYLIAADCLGLPIYPVLAPKHIFCRWSDNRNSINIETTQKGESFENYQYVEDLKISKISLQKGVYMKNVNRKNFEGIIVQKRSQWRYNNGLAEQAFEDAEKAVRMAPLFPLGYLVRAYCHLDEEEYQEGLSDLGRAISLDPNCSTFYKARANAFSLTGEYEPSINDLNTALQLDPADLEAILARGYCYAKIGGREKALADLSIPIHGHQDELELAEIKKEGYKILGML